MELHQKKKKKKKKRTTKLQNADKVLATQAAVERSVERQLPRPSERVNHEPHVTSRHRPPLHISLFLGVDTP